MHFQSPFVEYANMRGERRWIIFFERRRQNGQARLASKNQISAAGARFIPQKHFFFSCWFFCCCFFLYFPGLLLFFPLLTLLSLTPPVFKSPSCLSNISYEERKTKREKEKGPHFCKAQLYLHSWTKSAVERFNWTEFEKMNWDFKSCDRLVITCYIIN